MLGECEVYLTSKFKTFKLQLTFTKQRRQSDVVGLSFTGYSTVNSTRNFSVSKSSHTFSVLKL